MNQEAVLEVGREAFYMILKIGGPVMLAGLLIGLVIALFQTLTSIQEMTLTFVPKILIIFLTLILLLPFMMQSMVTFGESLFDRIIGL